MFDRMTLDFGRTAVSLATISGIAVVGFMGLKVAAATQDKAPGSHQKSRADSSETGWLPVLPVHAQHLAQQHSRFRQIVVMDEAPLGHSMSVQSPCPTSRLTVVVFK